MPKISTASAKAKGRKLQQRVRDDLLEAFSELEPDDVRSCPMGSNGRDIILSPAAKKLIPWDIECKARAKGFTPLYDALNQADRDDGLTPLAVVKQDRREPLAVMRWSDLVRLIHGRG